MKQESKQLENPHMMSNGLMVGAVFDAACYFLYLCETTNQLLLRYVAAPSNNFAELLQGYSVVELTH